MLQAERHATMIWEGNLAQGHGQITPAAGSWRRSP